MKVNAEERENDRKILRKYQSAGSMSLVPRFDEKEIEKYFLMFE